MALHGLEPLTCGVDPSYQFPIGDLVEYWDDYGNLRAGKISHAYGPLHGGDEGQPCEIRAGYGITGDDSESDQSMFADPERLSLRSDLADARACNAFQAFLAGVLAAPRRGRRPKSLYPLKPAVEENRLADLFRVFFVVPLFRLTDTI